MASTYQNLFLRFNKLPSFLEGISNIGININGEIKNKSLGLSRRKTDRIDSYDDDLTFLLGVLDQTKNSIQTPFYSRDYIRRKHEFYKYVSYNEIGDIIDKLSNSMVVYDDYNMFCQPRIDANLPEKYKDKVAKRFKKIYNYLGFASDQTAWEYARKWLIEGYMSLEIIYDDKEKPKEIIGFEELDPATLRPEYLENNKGEKTKVWVQSIQGREDRILPDNSIIFMSFSKLPGEIGCISAVDKLIRSFNLMRTMENTTMGWHIMNAQFRMKMVIPMGNKTTSKAKQTLGTIANKHREDLIIDHRSGEVSVNSQPLINYGKNIILPSRNGEEPKIEGISYDGPDLSNMEGAKYFNKKLNRDSGMPMSRFDENGGGGTTINFASEGISHDEVDFYRLLARYRNEFQKVIMKPWLIQCFLDYPELEEDPDFPTMIGLSYDSENLYEVAKRQLIEQAKLEHIEKLTGFMEDDDSTPFFSREFLLERESFMTKEELDRNKELKDAFREKLNTNGLI